MELYKQKRKLVTVTCDYCGKEFSKPESEYKRNIKLGRHNFCSRSCCGKHIGELHLPPTQAQLNAMHSIKNFSGNRNDEYTPFREILRVVRNRTKDFNLDLPYLKQLWESQNGVCPYTHLKLILPTWNNSPDIRYRASLDRIDSSKGYIKGNVQFITTPINYLKSTMSDEDTKSYLKEIAASIFIED